MSPRVLLDQNFDRRVAPLLRAAGYDVTVVGVDLPPGLPDRDIVARAWHDRRVILTYDRDFGELAVREGLPHAGIIYVRLRGVPFAVRYARVLAALDHQRAAPGAFLTVTAARIRRR